MDTTKFQPFDMAETLKTEEDIQNYINIVLEEGDTSELAHALGVIAKARGMTEIAKEAGIGRESLYCLIKKYKLTNNFFTEIKT